MGFPSPAADYTERRLNINDFCNISANRIIMETCSGFVVVDKSLPCTQGSTILIHADGRSELAKVMGGR